MVRSMTGFGRGEADADGQRLTVEVKTVNHRFFSSAMRLPREYSALEQALTARIRERVERGHAAVAFELSSEERPDGAFSLNRQALAGYLSALAELREAVGSQGPVDVVQLLALPGAVERAPRVSVPEDGFLALATRALEQALDGLLALREGEGERLANDLQERLASIAAAVERIAELAPQREARERERLTAKVSELLAGADEGVDSRIAQEIALLADRLDIAEELTRFRSHADLFQQTLAADGPCGRQLTFILQEMLREVNTMGSKANDSRIAQEVIGVKNELEKMREQVENIE